SGADIRRKECRARHASVRRPVPVCGDGNRRCRRYLETALAWPSCHSSTRASGDIGWRVGGGSRRWRPIFVIDGELSFAGARTSRGWAAATPAAANAVDSANQGAQQLHAGDGDREVGACLRKRLTDRNMVLLTGGPTHEQDF